MNQNIKNYLIILLLFLFIDIPMIPIINTDMYMKEFEKINRGPMKFDDNFFESNMFNGASLSYLLLTLGLYLFVIKPYNDINPDKKYNSLYAYKDITIRAILFGFVLYGFYNATNIATINEYDTTVALLDTIWGSVLCGLVTIVYFYLTNKK